MKDVVIHLGSNIEPAANIRQGAILIAEKFPIIRFSHVWSTPAVGASGPNFYNAAILCSTDMNLEDLKTRFLRPLEEQMGRIRSGDKYAARTMDMDIIIRDGNVLEPRLWVTAFILLPVAEVLPDLTNPKSGKSLQMLADELKPASGASQVPDFPLFIK